MANFISDDDMKKIEGQEAVIQPAGFVSDNDMSAMEESSRPSGLESGIRGLAQGASFDFADEITGGLESAAGSLGLVPDKTYEQARDESRAAYQAAQKANPIEYGAGQVGGAIGTMFIPGLNVAKGATLGGTALRAGLTSAAQGGLTSLGASEEDNIGGLARDTLVGAGIGGLIGGATPLAGNLISKASSKVGEGVRDVAEWFGGKAIGAENKVKDAGAYALDNKLLSPLGSTENIIAKNQAIINKSEAVQKGAKEIGGESLIKDLPEANKLYDQGKIAEKLLENKPDNKMFGLTDGIAGAGALGYGVTTGDWQNAGTAFVGKKLLSRYGVQNAALGLDKLSQILKSAPQMFGRYSQPLQNALTRGGTSLGATHYILQSTDPQYREMLDKMK